MKKLLNVLALAVILAALASASTTTCPTGYLSDYLGTGFQCTSGLLTFSNFAYAGTGDPTVIGADHIQVTPITTDGNEGFSFNPAMHASSVASFDHYQDSRIDFTVTAASPIITELHLYFNGQVTGQGTTSVAENYCIGGSLEHCAPASTGQLAVTNPPTLYNDLELFFDPVSSISVSKDILASSGSTGTATISDVRNTFSNSPEPGTIALLGSGLLALAGFARRRFSR